MSLGLLTWLEEIIDFGREIVIFRRPSQHIVNMPTAIVTRMQSVSGPSGELTAKVDSLTKDFDEIRRIATSMLHNMIREENVLVAVPA